LVTWGRGHPQATLKTNVVSSL